MKRNLTQEIAILGLLIALVAVATRVIQIPVPVGFGYIHLGDSTIFLAAVIFGRKQGAIAGGIGSALADFFSPYAQYTIPTLIVKGLMGYIVGTIADQESETIFTFRNLIAMAVGAIVMAAGYLATNTIMYGDFRGALVGGFTGDLIQSFGGAALFIPLGMALKRTTYFKKYILK